MNLFTPSKFMQVCALATSLIFSATTLQARMAPEQTFDYGDVPDLVAKAKQMRPAHKPKKAVKESQQQLDKSIEKVDAIAKTTKDAGVKKVLDEAVVAAKDANVAIKAKKDPKAKADAATEAADRALQKLGLQARAAVAKKQIAPKKKATNGKKVKAKQERSCSSSTSSSSSSSSSSSCCAEEAIEGLKKALHHCCCEILEEIDELSTALHCSQRTLIDHLPYTISASGGYCVAHDLSLDAESGAAIVVEVDNVDIDLGFHTITVNPDISAVLAEGVSNLSIHNGTFQNEIPALDTDINSIGALLLGDFNVSFEDVLFFNFRRGSEIHDSTDVLFTNCKFRQGLYDGNTNTAILAVLSDMITVEDSEFGPNVNGGFVTIGSSNISANNSKFTMIDDDTAFAVFAANASTTFDVDATSHNVSVSNCQFISKGVVLGSTDTVTSGVAGAEIRDCLFSAQTGSAISVQSGNGIVIRDCAATAAESNLYNLFQAIRFIAPGAEVKDITVTNCIFNQETAVQPGFDTVIMTACEGVLFENCTIDASPEPLEDYTPANVHIDQGSGSETLASPATKNVRFVNCTIRNAAPVGILVDLGNVVDGGFTPVVEIDSCQVTGAAQDGIRFVNVKSSVVKNSIVTNNGDAGIALLNSSQLNTLSNNVVFANEDDGLFFDSSSDFNAVKDNTVSNNGNDGIHNASALTNEFYHNSACHNGTTNCFGIEPSSLMVSPGGAYVNGANICCSSLSCN